MGRPTTQGFALGCQSASLRDLRIRRAGSLAGEFIVEPVAMAVIPREDASRTVSCGYCSTIWSAYKSYRCSSKILRPERPRHDSPGRRKRNRENTEAL